MKQLIAFVACKHAGKTLASQYLCEKYGYTKLSLADPIKYAIKEIFDFTDEQLWGDQKEVVDEYWGVSPRFVMQMVGTDFFRIQLKEKIPRIGDNIWVMLLSKRITNGLLNSKKIVVDDIRFPNEAEMIHKMGGTLVRIIRSNNNNTDHHISEQIGESITTDKILENNGSIEDLYHNIDQLMK